MPASRHPAPPPPAARLAGMVFAGWLLAFAPAPAAETFDPFAPPAGTAPAPGSAPPAATAPVSLAPDQLKAVVIISGAARKGTGFLAKMRDQYFIVTNRPLVVGNAPFTIIGMDGTKYPVTGGAFGAKDSPVAILKIPESKLALDIIADANAGAQVGDAVTIPGNASGAGVIAQQHGKLLGVGPLLLEVDAKFFQGYSGSPIVHRASGKVLGVANYVVMDRDGSVKLNPDAPGTRWFGYRLDNIKTWESIDVRGTP